MPQTPRVCPKSSLMLGQIYHLCYINNPANSRRGVNEETTGIHTALGEFKLQQAVDCYTNIVNVTKKIGYAVTKQSPGLSTDSPLPPVLK